MLIKDRKKRRKKKKDGTSKRWNCRHGNLLPSYLYSTGSFFFSLMLFFFLRILMLLYLVNGLLGVRVFDSDVHGLTVGHPKDVHTWGCLFRLIWFWAYVSYPHFLLAYFQTFRISLYKLKRFQNKPKKVSLWNISSKPNKL